MDRIEIRIFRVRGARDGDLPLPAKATAGSAGLDLCAALESDLVLEPGGRALVPTGFALAIPAGYEGQVRPRSGLALRHGVYLPNAPGTIDSDYRGEVSVILQNGGLERFVVRRGDRVAQLVITPVLQPVLEEVSTEADLGSSQRGGRGFGHSGR